MTARILLVEDDDALRRGVGFTLEQERFTVVSAKNIAEARSALRDHAFDLLLLDVQLPDGNGFDLCAEIRRTAETPIIFLTASDQEIDVVRGLDSGGDDYITKPFRLREFVSRVHAVLRRHAPARAEQAGETLRSGPLTLYRDEMRLDKSGTDIPLSLTEFRLLKLLMSRPKAVFSKEQILQQVWQSDAEAFDDNTVAVNIRRLREKIEDDPHNPAWIATVRGAGYRWNG